jgi:hypothetical protein
MLSRRQNLQPRQRNPVTERREAWTGTSFTRRHDLRTGEESRRLIGITPNREGVPTCIH